MDFEGQGTFRMYADAESRDSRPGVASAASGSIIPVILSGGGGSRLWPFSTNEMPKQFLPLAGPNSLFSDALDRVRDPLRFAAPIIVGSVRHASLCEQELQSDGEKARLILEPCARNTAVAIAMAASLACEEQGEDALLLITPSDHVIEDVAKFREAIRIGETAARAGRLVTFGIRPTGPDTGYGYVHMGAELVGVEGAMEVSSFVEKPPLHLAQEMVEGGEHLWNAGIFLFRAGTLLEEMRAFEPEIASAAELALATAPRDGIRIYPAAEPLHNCPSKSIDYAVMERSSRVAVVPMSPGWSDLGSWDALAALVGDSLADGPVTVLDCDNCYIRSDGLEVAALGLRDLIIVASGKRLLVLPRGRSQEVKRLLSAMESMAA
jgi:mannose-1-phosphate guanylyltransferase